MWENLQFDSVLELTQMQFKRESIFDVEVDILPQRFSGATLQRYTFATRGTMEVARNIGRLTLVDSINEVTFQCMWEPYVTSGGLILVHYTFKDNHSFLVQAVDGFIDRIEVV